MDGHFSLKPFAFCILSAALLVLAFPHPDLNFLAWIGLVPLFCSLDGTTARGAFGRGYLFGFLFYLGTLWWIGHVTVVGMLLLVAYLALFYAVFAAWYRFTLRFLFVARAVLVPAGYVVLEFIRSHAFTGFGWASLGHTQAAVPAVSRIAEWTGVAGVSFLVVYGNVVVKDLADRIGNKEPVARGLRRAGVFVVILLAALAVTIRFGVEPKTPIVKVALIQPNVTLDEMWTASMKPRVVRELLDMSRATLKEKPDLIIWPETAFPHFIWELPELFDQVQAFARDNKVSLLIGAVTREAPVASPALGGADRVSPVGLNEKYFNSAILISPEGKVVKTYSKRHLVLFGEYIPLRKELPFLASIVPIDDFTPGAESTIFELPNGVKFAALICFEDTIPELARRDVRNGADFLVNMTNDAWFGDSGQPRAHLYNAAFRSVENRRVLLRATNTGESCGVNASGGVDPCVEGSAGRRVLVAGTTVASFRPERGTTFYTKHGDVFTFVCGLAILIFITLRVILARRGIMEEAQKILVIDDEKMLQTMLKSVFASHGFQLLSALTGEEGLALAASEKPALIILDVIMPGLKGREVCKRLKADPATKDIPVLFLTAKSSVDDIQAEMAVGAIGHITKPINSMALVRQVKKLLGTD